MTRKNYSSKSSRTNSTAVQTFKSAYPISNKKQELSRRELQRGWKREPASKRTSSCSTKRREESKNTTSKTSSCILRHSDHSIWDSYTISSSPLVRLITTRSIQIWRIAYSTFRILVRSMIMFAQSMTLSGPCIALPQ